MNFGNGLGTYVGIPAWLGQKGALALNIAHTLKRRFKSSPGR